MQVKLNTYSGQTNANIQFNLINNYGSKISAVEIIGRIPNQGENPDNSSLINTFSSTLQDAITVTGVNADVYYSEIVNAGSSDLSWTQSVLDYSLIKSYKIVFNADIENEDSITIEYDISIPEQLELDQAIYNTMNVNYTYNEQSLQKVQSIKLATLQGPEVSLDIESQTENKSEVYGGQIVKYNVSITNDGTEDLQNVNLEYVVPEGAVYTKYQFVPDESRNR